MAKQKHALAERVGGVAVEGVHSRSLGARSLVHHVGPPRTETSLFWAAAKLLSGASTRPCAPAASQALTEKPLREPVFDLHRKTILQRLFWFGWMLPLLADTPVCLANCYWRELKLKHTFVSGLSLWRLLVDDFTPRTDVAPLWLSLHNDNVQMQVRQLEHEADARFSRRHWEL